MSPNPTMLLWLSIVLGFCVALLLALTVFYRFALSYWKGRAKALEDFNADLQATLKKSIANCDAAGQIINRQSERIVCGPAKMPRNITGCDCPTNYPKWDGPRHGFECPVCGKFAPIAARPSRV